MSLLPYVFADLSLHPSLPLFVADLGVVVIDPEVSADFVVNAVVARGPCRYRWSPRTSSSSSMLSLVLADLVVIALVIVGSRGPRRRHRRYRRSSRTSSSSSLLSLVLADLAVIALVIFGPRGPRRRHRCYR